MVHMTHVTMKHLCLVTQNLHFVILTLHAMLMRLTGMTHRFSHHRLDALAEGKGPVGINSTLLQAELE